MLDQVTRRSFVKMAGALGALAMAGNGAAVPAYADVPQAEADDEEERIVWSQCNVNCSSRCVFRHHVKGGRILYTETDNTGDENATQARACLRGRVYRHWINAPERLQYPMKRVGKRGEGKFERISWDEALDTIASELRRVIETYGNEAVFIHKGTGRYATIGTDDTKTGMLPQRLFSLLGGYLNYWGDHSLPNLENRFPFMFGDGRLPIVGDSASNLAEACNADLVLCFGFNPAETRMGGANATFVMRKVRESGAEVIQIDPRMNETCSGGADEWVPIRVGTDAALVAAIAHELIANDWVDLDFVNTYCIGYDDSTMPESAKGQNKSYKDYIMGTGYDMVEKTPEWAAPITCISADKIRELTRRIHEAEKLFVLQGWGVQRHHAGESSSISICMIPILTGQIGLPGTNTGVNDACPIGMNLVGSIPQSPNPVPDTIALYQAINAIDHGHEMTATNAGVRGTDQLKSDIKFLWAYACNALTNQSGGLNNAHEILADETKCEFIVVYDVMMTDSAKYADILLPDAMVAEQMSMSTEGWREWYQGVCVSEPAQDPVFETRPAFDVYADLAERFDVRDEFTEGLDNDGWIERIYKEGADAHPEMPTWEEIREQGFFKQELPNQIGLEAYRNDPVANPLETPSGKIEIYSERLAEMNDTWELDEGTQIAAIPMFIPGIEGYGSVTDEYPLYCFFYHTKAHVHSCYSNVELLQQAARHQLWINPVDAQARGIESGDILRVKSPHGEIEIEANVTNRILPGCVSLPTGAWHDADMYGDRIDRGGCCNTLVGYYPTPLSKQINANSNIVQVTKL